MALEFSVGFSSRRLWEVVCGDLESTADAQLYQTCPPRASCLQAAPGGELPSSGRI